MFEEDDNLEQREELIDDVEEKRFSFLRYLVIFFVWVLWTAGLSFFFIPKVEVAVKESGVIELINTMNNKVKTENDNKRLVTLYYHSLDGIKEYYSYTDKRGSSSYHDSIEALLKGTSESALKDGAVSYIAKETRLIGLSVSKGICYVDLTKDFLNSIDIEKASLQVINTLTSFSEINKVVILVEGSIF